jgi:WD40 repeat protein
VAFEKSALDWWLTPVIEGKAVRTGAHEALTRAGLGAQDLNSNPSAAFASRNVPAPRCWIQAGDRLIFSTFSGDSVSLWETAISRGGRIHGGFQRLTTGAGNDVGATCASNGTVAFTNLEFRRDVWSLPFDLDHGRATGTLNRLTNGPVRREHASLSGDGRLVAFASAQSGGLNIWLRDLTTGSESHLASSSFVQRYPVVSPSGNRVAFSSYENDSRILYVVARGAPPERLCEGCLRATDWSRDETGLLVFGGTPYQIELLDIASRQRTALLKHAVYPLLYGRFSTDNRWVSFTERTGPNRAWVSIAPVDGAKPIPESAWVRISEEGPEDWANWSPDGKTLYFTSERDGHYCLWGQRLDERPRRPVGQPFPAEHFHGPAFYDRGGWSAAGGRIAMALREDAGNIWVMSRNGR